MSDLQSVFNAARQRILAGEQLSVSEQRELITQLRANRFTAAETSATAKKRTSKAVMTDDELADSLKSLGL
jgi:uncharacterized membrane protein